MRVLSFGRRREIEKRIRFATLNNVHISTPFSQKNLLFVRSRWYSGKEKSFVTHPLAVESNIFTEL